MTGLIVAAALLAYLVTAVIAGALLGVVRVTVARPTPRKTKTVEVGK